MNELFLNMLNTQGKWPLRMPDVLSTLCPNVKSKGLHYVMTGIHRINHTMLLLAGERVQGQESSTVTQYLHEFLSNEQNSSETSSNCLSCSVLVIILSIPFSTSVNFS